MRLAWWTCALLAVVQARIYNRCELARDLVALGVHADHISTWVCIAYHESRFDTAANNPYSGDHGIFQISELYWCGPGKACRLSCNALRDEDISDDLECALQVHEEHTRLQGDGFLAWVVYPQHCRQNTKKYLADCDQYPKNATFQSERRSFNTYQNNNYRPKKVFNAPYPNIDNLLPPYLTISSIFRGSYGKMLDPNKINGVDWYNYKYDKVDELKLPVFSEKGEKKLTFDDFIVSTAAPSANAIPTTSVTRRPSTLRTTKGPTTTTTYVPPVRPWRYIETNDFRKKVSVPDTKTTTTTTNKPYYYTTRTEKYTISTTTNKPPTTESTSYKYRTSATPTDISTKVKSMTASYKSQTTPVSTIKPVNITYTAYKLPTFTTSYKTRTGETPTTSKVTIKTNNDVFRSFSTTTLRPLRATFAPWWVTTAKPSSTTLRTTSIKPSTRNWYTFTSRYTNTKFPTTTYRSYIAERTIQTTESPKISEQTTQTTLRTTPKRLIRITERPFWQTERPSTRSTSQASTVPTTRSVKTSRTTQSIFDLYLNPTKPPTLPKSPFRGTNKYRLSIFSGGTTPSPSGK